MVRSSRGVALAVALAASTGCSSSDSGGGTTCSAVTPNAGPNQLAYVGRTVTVDALMSTSADGQPLTFQWQLSSRPAASAAALSVSSGPITTFVPDVAGTFVVKLRATGSCAAETTVQIYATVGGSDGGCTQVIARAGGDRQVSTGETVSLSGATSVSLDGAPLSYVWTLVAAPIGSTAVLSPTVGPYTSFTADLGGSYAVQLAATGSCTATTTVQITASNSPPVAMASAQPAGTVPVRAQVTLSGASSYDPDHEPITYAWTLAAPAGSVATLSSAADVAPRFTPDVAGHYVATLVVTDAHASSTPAQVAVDALDVPPVAVVPSALYGNVGAAVTIDASGSHDPDGDAISYAWSIASAPQGSAATVEAVSPGVVRLVPDVAGPYVVHVVVSDSAATTGADVALTVWQAIRTVSFRPIGVEYDRPLDRIVAVADQPPALHLYDPTAGTDVAVALPLAPTCVSVSPDGKIAAVGHAAWVSVVDLEAQALVTTWPTTADAGDVVVTDPLTISGRTTRFAYVYPSRDQWSAIHAVDLGNGAETQGAGYSVYAGGRERLQPGSNHIFLIELGLSPQQLYRWDFSTTTGAIAYGGESPYWGDYAMGSNLWISDDGAQILMSAGTRFRTSDMTYSGKLPLTYLLWADAPAAPSAAAGKWLVQPGTSGYSYPPDTTSDTAFWTYDAVYLANPARFDLPKLGVGTAAFPLHGRYVFFDRAGTTMISIAQVDASAALLNDYAVLTF